MNIMMNNKAAGKRKMTRLVRMMLVGLTAMAQFAFAANQAVLQKADFVALPGDEVEIRLGFDSAAPAPVPYQIDKPARLVFDLPNTKSGLSNKNFNLGSGNARSLTVIDNNDRTRVIVNLTELSGFETRTVNNDLLITVGKNKSGSVAAAAAPRAQQVAAAPASKSINHIDFRRGDQGDGQIMIDLSPSVAVDVQQQGNKIIAKFLGAKLPEQLRRRLDVTDFATPVRTIEAHNDGSNGVITILPQGEFEYLAYQADSKLTISVKPILQDNRRKKEFAYTGEKLSLNFQDIEVRSVLQLIADFTSMNLVASDTVSGKITLRLQNVPWDQALDLILKTKGLDKRTIGNVMLVAPADEIAARERLEMESNNQSEQLASLRTEFIQVNYAKAADMLALIAAGGDKESSNRILSSRGSASVDPRTNTLIVVDTAKRIDDIREMITKLDIPVKQVMIESRIVLATTSFAKELGVKWGFAHDNISGGTRYMAGGSRQALNDIRESTGGTYTFEGDESRNGRDGTLMVDLGVSGAGTSSLAIGLMDVDNIVLDLELSALQSDGHGEIVATPKVMTADKQKARIASGQQIPYLEASSSGATSIKFINAELSLEVTPSITPDGRINMELLVNNDSPGDVLAATGTRAINTNRVATNVVVDDGQTVVLGGIFKEETSKGVVKTPFLGDIPYLGRLFRQDIQRNEKAELLIFVTPRLMADALATK